jgi:hypothetical protein
MTGVSDRDLAREFLGEIAETRRELAEARADRKISRAKYRAALSIIDGRVGQLRRRYFREFAGVSYAPLVRIASRTPFRAGRAPRRRTRARAARRLARAGPSDGPPADPVAPTCTGAFRRASLERHGDDFTSSRCTMSKADVPPDLERLAVMLAPKVAEIVFARLAGALGTTAAPYSTRAGREPPEFQARTKVWRKTAPAIPGAVKLGRWWSVPHAAYSAWIEAQATTAPAPTPKTNTAPWTPAAALAAAQIRGSR